MPCCLTANLLIHRHSAFRRLVWLSGEGMPCKALRLGVHPGKIALQCVQLLRNRVSLCIHSTPQLHLSGSNTFNNPHLSIDIYQKPHSRKQAESPNSTPRGLHPGTLAGPRGQLHLRSCWPGASILPQLRRGLRVRSQSSLQELYDGF